MTNLHGQHQSSQVLSWSQCLAMKPVWELAYLTLLDSALHKQQAHVSMAQFHPAGLVLPILGALPDAFIIAVSGLAGSNEEAQQQACSLQRCKASMHALGPAACRQMICGSAIKDNVLSMLTPSICCS